MTNRCQITGKGTVYGHNVSHSQVKTNRTFKSNLHWKKLLNPANNQMMRIKVSSAGLRTYKKWISEGKNFDLRSIVKKNTKS